MQIKYFKIIPIVVYFILFIDYETAMAQSFQSRLGSTHREIIFVLGSQDSIVKLPDKFIIRGSIFVHLDTVMLKSEIDYVYDYHQNQILLLPNLLSKIKNNNEPNTIRVQYRIFPFSFKEKYAQREIIYRYDTTSGQIIQTAIPSQTFTIQNIFGDNIQKSGSLIRGFSFGTNRDFSLNSGFRMQMSGQLSQNIDITAALTDENSPLQPEGNTQTLQEIDKVFIEFRTKNLSATLGDFNVEYSEGEFGRFSRKLQGGLGSARYETKDAKGGIWIAGAATRGKYHTNSFTCIEGVQGPYRLTGKHNERSIIIIAGSEKVYIDGLLAKRGTENDYSIDYALGELTFSSRRLVNGNTRIVVDFEYTDRKYVRNFFNVRGSSSFFNDNIKITTSYMRESDDLDNLIDITLSDTDKDSLKSAGDNYMKASLNGVQYVGKGVGQYVSVDTLINSQWIRFYRFLPSDSSADYSIIFSYVGSNNGDYEKISIGNYQFVGIKKGSYLAVKFLPLPQVQSIINVDLSSQITEYFGITCEGALSDFDANRFSKIDDFDNRGSAYNFNTLINPKNVKIANTNIGSIDLRLKRRFLASNFNPIDRINDIEFDRKWNITSSHRSAEVMNEGILVYSPISWLKIGSGYGDLKIGNLFLSNRYESTISIADVSLPKLSYRYESINSKEDISDVKGRWDRHIIDSEFNCWNFIPGFKYEHERKKMKSINLDTLKQGSLGFDEYSPRFTIKDFLKTTFFVEFKWRNDYGYNARKLIEESKSISQVYSLSTRPLANLSSTIDLTIRDRNYTEIFRSLLGGNTKTFLIRKLTRYSALNRGVETDLYYDAATQKSAKLERVFRRVKKGEGNYTYLGDLDSNFIASENEFRMVRFDGDYILLTIPSDKLYPVVDIKFNTRLKLMPSRFIRGDKWYLNGISILSSETYFRIEEKSTEEKQNRIYLLNTKYFLNEKSTIVGNKFLLQDLFLFEQSDLFSVRLRFQQRTGLTQYALSTEKNYRRERSVRVRWQLIKEISNQTEYENRREQLTASVNNYRVMNIEAENLNSDWIYRPYRRIEFGFLFGVGRAQNKTEFSVAVSNLNFQGVKFIYSFAEHGIVKMELTREEINLRGELQVIPFELTGGRVIGKTWIVKLSSEYRITDFLQTSLNYECRSETQRVQIHTLRGEIRAFF